MTTEVYKFGEATGSDGLGLSGWENRLKITIDATKIDSDLTHFPVAVFLNSSAGSGNDDVTAVFDELVSDANRFKIAVTQSDGTTQLYVEIEQYDDANERALFWVSKTGWVIDDTTDTVIYLYYDSSQSDNTTYVSDVGDTPAQSVWDSNYAGVWHLDSSLKDSTSNNNDGTDNNTTQVSDIYGEARDFDGTVTDHIAVNGLVDDIDSATGTITAWSKTTPDSGAQDMMFSVAQVANSSYTEMNVQWDLRSSQDRLRSNLRVDGTVMWQFAGALDETDPLIGNWALTTVTHNGTQAAFYLNDGAEISGTWDFDVDRTQWWADLLDATNVITTATLGNLKRYNRVDGYWSWNDDLGEVRISITNRSEAWIAADYNSFNDTLIKELIDNTPTPTLEKYSFGAASETGQEAEDNELSLNSNSASPGTETTDTETWSHNIAVGSNRILIVGVQIEDAAGGTPAVTGVTYNSNSFTKIGHAEIISAGPFLLRCELWAMLETDLPASGASNIEVTLDEAGPDWCAGAIALDDAVQQIPDNYEAATVEGQGTITDAITTAEVNSWLIDVVGAGGTGAYTANNQTEVWETQNLSSAGAMSRRTCTTAQEYTNSWTTAMGDGFRQALVICEVEQKPDVEAEVTGEKYSFGPTA